MVTAQGLGLCILSLLVLQSLSHPPCRPPLDVSQCAASPACEVVELERTADGGVFGVAMERGIVDDGPVYIGDATMAHAVELGAVPGFEVMSVGDLLVSDGTTLEALFQEIRAAPATLRLVITPPGSEFGRCMLRPCGSRGSSCYEGHQSFFCQCPFAPGGVNNQCMQMGDACDGGSAAVDDTEAGPVGSDAEAQGRVKVALVLSGQPRGMDDDALHRSMQRHIIGPYSADVYFHAWLPASSATSDSHEDMHAEELLRSVLMKRYKPVKYEFEQSRYLCIFFKASVGRLLLMRVSLTRLTTHPRLVHPVLEIRGILTRCWSVMGLASTTSTMRLCGRE